MFVAFPKIPRLNRDIVITEKIDGTNAQIFIQVEMGLDNASKAIAHRALEFGGYEMMYAGSRTRLITPEDDNYGFARWAQQNAEQLFTLGPGQHFGEWWGGGIQRGYGLTKGEKRFSLFNTARWTPETTPACCSVVPVLYSGPFSQQAINDAVDSLRANGSVAMPGFMKAEGIIVYHTAANSMFKVTVENDASPKALVKEAE